MQRVKATHFFDRRALSRMTAAATPALSDSALPKAGIVIFAVTSVDTPSEIPFDSLPMTMNPPWEKSRV